MGHQRWSLSPAWVVRKTHSRGMLKRHFLQAPRQDPGCSIAVVGGGPAGVCVAATAALRSECSSVVFFDAGGFRSGMLQQYPTVPANTKLEMLHDFLTSGPVGSFARRFERVARAVQQVRDEALPTPPLLQRRTRDFGFGGLTPDEVGQLFDHDQEFEICSAGWPRLCDMAGVCQSICAEMRRMPHVTMVEEAVTHVEHAESSGWIVNGHQVDAVVFCQGATPHSLPHMQAAITQSGARTLSLEEALDRDSLQRAVFPSDRIAVVGNSHTGALILQNLMLLGHDSDDRVRLFGLQPVRVARWSERASAYLYTATGLKGLAAAFALEELAKDEGSDGLQRSIFSRQGGPADLQAALDRKELDVVILATGFAPRAYPHLQIDGRSLVPSESRAALKYSAADCSLTGEEVPPGLFEVGISRPEYYTDSAWLGHPVCAFEGGPETQREGWRKEHVVGWNGFGQRAEMVVAQVAAARTFEVHCSPQHSVAAGA